ncbi:MAG: hypothetical protein SFY56_05610 [Bacteroidota bacterium]|nr:hypothetical protein [Bacteroidota bacterium]
MIETVSQSIMKQKLVLFFLILFLKNFACDICGSFMGITPYDNQSQICLLHRYRVFNGYRNYQETSNFIVPGAYKIAHNDSSIVGNEPQTHSTRDYESYKALELRGKYFISSRVEVNCIIPVQQIKTKYNDIRGENTGIVDPSLFFGYHLIKRVNGYSLKQRMIIGTGVKFPFGNINAQHNNKRLGILNQNGTGSWDSFYYLNYIISKSRFGINSNTLFKLNGTNKYGERIGNSINQIINTFVKCEVKNLKLFPALVANYEYTKGVYVKKRLQENTNMNALLLGPSLDLSYKNFVFNSSFQFNVYERVGSQNLSTAGRWVVALTYNFMKKN